MPRQVTAFSNATVKRLRSLRDKKARRAEGLFLAEGLRIIDRGARQRPAARDHRLLAPRARSIRSPPRSSPQTEAAGGDAIETTPDILSKMSGKDNPQMLLGAYRQPDTSLERIDRSKAPLWIVAQALRDPGNIGTILQDRRRGRRRRADPGRRLRRSLLGRGGARIDGRAVHPGRSRRRAGTNSSPGCAPATGSWSEPASRRRTIISTPSIARPCFLLIGNEQQGLPGRL